MAIRKWIDRIDRDRTKAKNIALWYNAETGMSPHFFMGHNKKQPKKGFTLVELLVVISIISLLASVVLAALQSARTKADDIARNEIIIEYTKALALYFHENGTYPSPGSPITLYCLGDFADDKCGLNGTTNNESASLNSALAVYYPSLPTLKAVGTHEGPLYSCPTTCAQPQITWRLQQTTATCIRGVTPSSFPSYTTCTLTLN